MYLSKMMGAWVLISMLGACASDGSFDVDKAATVGAGVLQATTLDENTVRQAASLAAVELDRKSQLAPQDSLYAIKLAQLTQDLQDRDGLTLNFKVYMNEEINAFAMADGTVRVHSGLLDAMPDDQVLAVIGHEIGHVKLKHSYKQMREQLLTNSVFQAAISVGGTIGVLTSSQLGELAYTAVNAHFSQADELEADVYAVKTLKAMGKDPYAMKRSIETLQNKYGSGGGFLSSHPSNDQRISSIQAVIDSL